MTGQTREKEEVSPHLLSSPTAVTVVDLPTLCDNDN